MTASRVPQAIPASMAVAVIFRVTFMPAHRNGRAPGMELQSSSYMLAPPADVTGYPRSALDPAHEGHDDDVDEDVQDRHGDERLVGLGSVVDELPPHGRHLEQG